jgi:hypothetical protein
MDRPVRQPFRKRDFVDFRVTPFDCLAALAPAVGWSEFAFAAIITHSFIILHDHRTPRLDIVSKNRTSPERFQDEGKQKNSQ